MTKGMIERRGLKIETHDPTGKPIMVPGETNPRQLLPDYGFDYHPGKAVWGGIAESHDLGDLRQLPGLPGHAEHRLPAAGNMKKLAAMPPLLPSLMELKAGGMSNRQADNFYKEQFNKALGLTESPERMIEVAGEPLLVTDRFITRKGGKSKISKADRGRYVPLFNTVISDPDEVWLTPMKNDKGQYVLRRRQLAFWRNGEADDTMAGFAVLDIDRGAARGVTIYDMAGKELDRRGFNRLDDKDVGARRGVLLYRKKK